ncbi:MAG: glycoside hydrolase family 3, partial [Deltaproteobacteria bacterium]
GITLNFAPVVDLNINPNNPVIGKLERSFSADPQVVTRMALAFIRAHHVLGIRCTLKHFPGHGSSSTDSHLGFVDVTKTWSPVELEPYKNIIGAGMADAIMTAHVFNAKLDEDYPATLSKRVITGLLREKLGYGGVIISDDMQMGAIRKYYGFEQAIRLAIDAGVDILIVANNTIFDKTAIPRAISIIRTLVKQGKISVPRIEASYRRIHALKQPIS